MKVTAIFVIAGILFGASVPSYAESAEKEKAIRLFQRIPDFKTRDELLAELDHPPAPGTEVPILSLLETGMSIGEFQKEVEFLGTEYPSLIEGMEKNLPANAAAHPGFDLAPIFEGLRNTRKLMEEARQRAEKEFPGAEFRNIRQKYLERVRKSLGNISGSRSYSELSRIFLLVDPLFVSDDVHHYNAISPQHRFDESTPSGQEQPAWENFVRGFDELGMGLGMGLAGLRAGGKDRGFWDRVHRLFLQNGIEGVSEQDLQSGATKNWDREHLHSFSVDLTTWNGFGEELQKDLARFFHISDSPEKKVFGFKSVSELSTAFPGLKVDEHSTPADSLMAFMEAEVAKVHNPIDRAAKILYLFPRLHPYLNGNGREARAWAANELLKEADLPVGLPTNDFFATERELQRQVKKAVRLGAMWRAMIEKAREEGIAPQDFFQKVYRGSALEGLILYTPANEKELGRYIQYLEELPTDTSRLPEAEKEWAQGLTAKITAKARRQLGFGTSYESEFARHQMLEQASAEHQKEKPLKETLLLFNWKTWDSHEEILRLAGYDTSHWQFDKDLFRGGKGLEINEEVLKKLREYYVKGNKKDAAGAGLYADAVPTGTTGYGTDLLVIEVTAPPGQTSWAVPAIKTNVDAALESGNFGSLPPVARYSGSWFNVIGPDPSGQVQIRVRPPSPEDARYIYNKFVDTDEQEVEGVTTGLDYLSQVAVRLWGTGGHPLDQRGLSAQFLFKRLLLDPELGFKFIEKNREKWLEAAQNGFKQKALFSILKVYEKELPNDPRTAAVAEAWFGARLKMMAPFAQEEKPFLSLLSPRSVLLGARSYLRTEDDLASATQHLTDLAETFEGKAGSHAESVAHSLREFLANLGEELLKDPDPKVRLNGAHAYVNTFLRGAEAFPAAENPVGAHSDPLMSKALAILQEAARSKNRSTQARLQAAKEYGLAYAVFADAPNHPTLSEAEKLKAEVYDAAMKELTENPADFEAYTDGELFMSLGMGDKRLDRFLLEKGLALVQRTTKSSRFRIDFLLKYGKRYNQTSAEVKKGLPTPEGLESELVSERLKEVSGMNPFAAVDHLDGFIEWGFLNPHLLKAKADILLALLRDKNERLEARLKGLKRYREMETKGVLPSGNPSGDKVEEMLIGEKLDSIKKYRDPYSRLSTLNELADGMNRTHLVSMLTGALKQIASSEMGRERSGPLEPAKSQLIAERLLLYSKAANHLLEAITEEPGLRNDEALKVLADLVTWDRNVAPFLTLNDPSAPRTLAKDTNPLARRLGFLLAGASAGQGHDIEDLAQRTLNDWQHDPEVRLAAAGYLSRLAGNNDIWQLLDIFLARAKDTSASFESRAAALDKYGDFRKAPPPTEFLSQRRRSAFGDSGIASKKQANGSRRPP